MTTEFESIAASATALDAEQAAVPAIPGQPAPVVPDPVAETTAALTLAITGLGYLLPYLPHIYTADVCATIAEKWQPVADKYGWSLQTGWLDKFAPEIGLAIVVLPLAKVTATAHKAWLKDKEAQAHARPVESPEAVTVSPAPGETTGQGTRAVEIPPGVL